MEFTWIGFAFICGLLTKLISLPPSIGYLAAGFILNFLGYQADSMITVLADIGITLMLFTIGLKLNVKDLIKPEVWFGSLSHTIFWLLFGLIIVKAIALAAIPLFSDLDIVTSALIVFALSFSSTVCVVKLMEDHGEMRTRHGKLAIGILVMQDIIAVVFLVLATGKVPSPWAALLLLFIPLKPYINKGIDKAGHGELIPLMGFFIMVHGLLVFYFCFVQLEILSLLDFLNL